MYFSSIFFISGIIFFSYFIKKSRLLKIQNLNLIDIFYIFLLIVIFFGYLTIFINYSFSIFLKIFFYLISFSNLLVLIYFKEIYRIFKNNKKNFLFIFSVFLILLYFFNTFLPASDADSLDYHLGVPKLWLLKKGYYHIEFWDHLTLVGSGEFLNFFGILVGSENFISSINFLSIIFFIEYLNNIVKKKNTNSIIIIFSLPVLISLIFSQKPYVVMCVGFTYFFIEIIKKNVKSKTFLLTSILNICLASKYSFIPIYIIALIFYIYLNPRNFIYFVKINLYTFLLFAAPIYLKNIYYYENPLVPFFSNIFISKIDNQNALINFSNYLKLYHSEYRSFQDFFLMIVSIFIPLSFSKILSNLGVVPILILINSKKLFTFKYINELLILILLFVVFMMIGQFSARYYFVFALFISYIYLKLDLNKLVEKTAIIYCLGHILLITTFLANLNLTDVESVKSKISPEYKISRWVNNNIKENYITDIRSNYYLDFDKNKIFSLKQWEKKLNKDQLKLFLKANNIVYAIIKDDPVYYKNYAEYLKFCGDLYKKITFDEERRNFLVKKNIKYLILKINNERCR